MLDNTFVSDERTQSTIFDSVFTIYLNVYLLSADDDGSFIIVFHVRLFCFLFAVFVDFSVWVFFIILTSTVYIHVYDAVFYAISTGQTLIKSSTNLGPLEA